MPVVVAASGRSSDARATPLRRRWVAQADSSSRPLERRSKRRRRGEFDKSEQEERIERQVRAGSGEQKSSDRAEAVAACAGWVTADGALRCARAELDVRALGSAAPSTSRSRLTLEETKARLAQLRRPAVATRHRSRSLSCSRKRATKPAQRKREKHIDNMTLRAPFDGLVAARTTNNTPRGPASW